MNADATIRIETEAEGDAGNNNIFRLVGAIDDAGGNALNAATPVRISGSSSFTIYALPGTATVADLVSALDTFVDSGQIAYKATLTSGTGTIC